MRRYNPPMLARWLPPVALSALILALAPFVGVLQRWLRESVGLAYLVWVTGALAVAAAAALLWGVLRIRERRAVRYGLLGLAGVLVALQVVGWATGEAEVDTVERVHLLEYGLLGALFERAFRRRHGNALLPVLAVGAVALVGIADEWVQWLTPVRTGDGRDVLLNAWAGVIGYLVAVALSTEGGRLRRPEPASRRLAAVLGAAVVLAAGAFVDVAHLGHEIRDPRAGHFVSWHSPDELVRAAEDRGSRWAGGERPEMRPLSLEDTYYTEAGWHAQARNEAVARGAFVRAWRENRILERWYGPYLRLAGAGWPQAQREQVESEVRQRLRRRPDLLERSPGYRSPVLRRRVVTAPRSLVWGAVALLAGGLLALAVRPAPPRAPAALRSRRP